MTTNESKRLLEDFETPSYEQWRTAAEALLKGAPFDKKMLTPTPEGITFQPIYNKSDLDKLEHVKTLPGADGFVRGTRADGYLHNQWEIAQEIDCGEPSQFNQIVRTDLGRGQTALTIKLDAATLAGLDPDEAKDGDVAISGLSLASLKDMQQALEGVETSAISIYFDSGCAGLQIAGLFNAWLKQQKIDAKSVKGSFDADPLGVLASKGTLPTSLETQYDRLAALASYQSANSPDFTAVGVSGLNYHNAGASATQELAIMLATGVTYVREMAARGVDLNEAARQIRFTVSIGGNFFMELAKIRALRMLWAKAIVALGGSTEGSKIRLHARTGSYNKTVCDPYVNMLRTTTEALAGAVGGVDSLAVGAFDEIVRPSSVFSRRIARNTQIILQEECELTAVVDPAGGSWAIETLTDQVASESWKLFQQIEVDGGIAASLATGKVQSSIAECVSKREKSLAQRRATLVGTNNYPNLTETPLEVPAVDAVALRSKRAKALTELRTGSEVQVDTAVMAKLAEVQNGGETVAQVIEAVLTGASLGEVTRALGSTGDSISVDALPQQRLAHVYEALREASAVYTKANGHGPKLFLANMGALRRHKGRADFTRGFFETGGFEVIYPSGFNSADEAAEAAVASGAQLVVVCGTDDDYAEQFAGYAKAMKAKGLTVILAGFPGDNETAFREAGMDDYIFVKSNNLEVNTKYLKQLGVIS